MPEADDLLGLPSGESEQPVGPEAEGRGLADDQVVQEADADDVCGGLDSLGQFAVLIRRGGVAAWVMVGENEAAGLVGQRALDDLPDVHG